MNKELKIKRLAEFLQSLIECAKKDEILSISWFKDTENERFCIVGGWCGGFSEDYSDVFCISKSSPEYAMSVKIAINEGPYAYTDFEMMSVPLTEDGTIAGPFVTLEWDEDVESLAAFLLSELEWINKEYGGESNDYSEKTA